MAAGLSAVHALEPHERDLALMIAAGREPHDAFRAIVRKHARNFVRRGWGSLDALESGEAGPTPSEVKRAVEEFLAAPYVVRYISELGASGSNAARLRLQDETLVGESAAGRDAAKQLIANEDKLGVVDAFQRWADLLVEAGAEIQVALPPVPPCAQCGAHQPALFAAAPLRDLFRKHYEAEFSGDV